MALTHFGLQKTTLIDFPGEVAATIFTPGCNMRCPFCHNPELVEGSPPCDMLSRKELYLFLEKRKNILGGVCITGGEPIIHKDLGEIIEFIHSLNLKVKIDTNGTFPEQLKELNADYIAMDIKTSLEKYRLLGFTGDEKDKSIENLITSSIHWIISSGIDHQFRTTVVPEIVTIEDIKKIAGLAAGEQNYVLNSFRPDKTLNPEYSKIIPYPLSTLEEMKSILEQKNINCKIKHNIT